MSQKENKAANYKFSNDMLLDVLSKKLNQEVKSASFSEEQLQGGTVADVRLIKGIATTNEDEVPFKVVLKVQDKWERYADENSWRREYDLYLSDIRKSFTDDFSWPEYYHMEFAPEQTIIWMEFAEGVPGSEFTTEMYVKAAESLGRFQGKLYKEQPSYLKDINNLSTLSFIKDTFVRYSKWEDGNKFIRNTECALPDHIQKMLIELIDQGDQTWEKIEKLPVVLSQRDYWFTNIFYDNGNIKCIDWDTTGWGHLGEDIASLISDEVDPKLIPILYKECVPAYYKGFMDYVPEFDINLDSIYELVLTTFGLRLMANYMFNEDKDGKALALSTLESIYSIKN